MGGGGDDGAVAIALDKNNSVYVTGIVNAQYGFLVPGIGAGSDIGTVKYGQKLPGSNCENAIPMPPGNPSCMDSVLMMEDEMWFSFVADSSNIRLVINLYDSNTVFRSIEICSGCSIVEYASNFDSVRNFMNFKTDSLLPGQSYKLKIKRDSSYGEISKFKICIFYLTQSHCTPATQTCQKINNGDFSQVEPGYNGTDPFDNGDVCYWDSNNLSPQIATANPYSSPYYAHMWACNGANEAIITNTNTVLVPNQTYVLSYYYRFANNPNDCSNITATAIDQVNVVLFSSPFISPILLVSDNNVSNTSWQLRQVCFSVTQNYSTLGIAPVQSQNAQVWLDIDDVSVVEFGVNASSDLQIVNCGSSAQLSANLNCNIPSVTYSWLPVNGLDNPSVANPVACLKQSTTYTVTVTTPDGCTATDNVYIEVIPLTVNPSASVICKGQSVILTASGGSNYSWSPATGLSASTGAVVTANPSITTTYTVTSDINSFCNCSTNVTVTVNAPQISISGNTAICPGQTTTLTASGGLSYLWSTGHTDATITVSPDVPAIYTVTATDANGCTDSENVTVTVLQNPPAEIIILPENTIALTCDNNLTYWAYDPEGHVPMGLDYEWSSPQASSFSDPTGSNTAITWTDPSTDATLTLTVISQFNGCTAIVSINIPGCDCPAIQQSDIKITNITASAFATDPQYSSYFSGTNPYSFSNGLGANGILYIFGVFEVDVPFEFRTSLIKMGQGAKILITKPTGPGDYRKLYVRCSDIAAGCNEMWDGIYIEPGTRDNFLYMKGNENCTVKATCTTHYVRDAENAVVSVDGGNFELYCYKFLNNHKGVFVTPYSGAFIPYGGNSIGKIDGCTFITETPGLITPRTGERGRIGVDITGVGGFQVGDATYQTNTFENLDIGIQTESSNVNVKNNLFQNITQTCIPTPGGPGKPATPCPVIACIYGIGLSNQAASYTLEVGSNSNSDKNIFKNSTNGIWVENSYNLNTRKNQFINMRNPSPPPAINNLISKTCVFVRNAKESRIEVNNNKFNKFNTGIWVLNSYENNVYVNGNSFNNPGSGADVGNVAVKLESAIAKFAICTTEVKNNDIRRITTGIWFRNFYPCLFSFPLVRDNFIVLNSQATAPKNGILFENSYGFIERNTINATGNFPVTMGNTNGIQIKTSPFTVIKDNKLFKMSAGIRCWGNSVPSIIECNEMRWCYRGVYLDNLSAVGIQSGTQYLIGNSTNPSDNQWYNNNQERIFSTLVGTKAPDWYFKTSPAQFNLPTSSFTPGGIVDHPLTGTFTNDCAGGNIQQQQVQVALAEKIKHPGLYSLLQLEQQYAEKELVFSELMKYPSLMQLSTPDDTVLQNFYDSVIQTNMGRIQKTMKYIADGSDMLAMQEISSVSPSGAIEQNHKDVLNVYLNSWLKGRYWLDSTERTMLTSIAIQNPVTGGRGVYTARVMLDTLIHDEVMPVSQKTGNILGETVPDAINSKDIFFIGENTNQGVMSVNAEKCLTIEIINIYGQKVETYKCSENKITGIMQSERLQPGIYFVKIIFDNGKMMVLKKVY
ncbi:MAG: hypothetical protein HYY40_10970 [Bacteroidetes bacterium]|nr:hypothetical protein [Bacteroidota bacterium]